MAAKLLDKNRKVFLLWELNTAKNKWINVMFCPAWLSVVTPGETSNKEKKVVLEFQEGGVMVNIHG